jgi:hypothetical protein
MTTSRRRLAIVTTTTLALLLSSVGFAAAQAPADEGLFAHRGFGPGHGRLPVRERLGDVGRPAGSVVRVETTVDLGEQGIEVHRRDRGTATATDESSLSYSLVTGELATVTVDESTRILSATEATTRMQRRSRWSRPFRSPRMMVSQIELSAITEGTTVVAWSVSQDDGTFLARQVVAYPAAAAEPEATTDDAAPDEEVEASPAA